MATHNSTMATIPPWQHHVTIVARCHPRQLNSCPIAMGTNAILISTRLPDGYENSRDGTYVSIKKSDTVSIYNAHRVIGPLKIAWG